MAMHTVIKEFKCDICEKIFGQKGNLTLHMTLHTGIKDFKCDICEKTFAQKGNLAYHITTHFGIKEFKCELCKNTFRKKTHLTDHIATHTGIKNFKCDICEKTFAQRSSLIKHMTTHTGIKKFKCEICEKAYSQRNGLTYHMTTHTGIKLSGTHTGTGIKKVKCELCEKTFRHNGHLREHMTTHTGIKNFKCDVCEKAFAQKRHLTQHMTTHTAIKKFKCNICEKTYYQKSNHMAIHTGIKDFKCNICNEAFERRSYITRHMVTHTGIRSFKCNICDKAFLLKCHLTSHIRTHSGVKEFKCETCEKAYFSKSHLTKHSLTHTGIQNFKCDTCGKEYLHRTSLMKHNMAKHTGIQNLKCEICEKTFCDGISLRAHMAIHTGIKDLKCEICNETFGRRSHLTKHMVTHTGIQNFKCDTCGKAFGKKSSLIIHLVVHTGIQNFKCEICQKAFGTKSSLTRHLVIHTGIHNFKCEICEKTFGNNSCLRAHMAIHTGHKNFKCDICEESFSQKKHLSDHKATHTEIRDFKCGLCDKAFRKSGSLRMHMATHTGIKNFKCETCGKAFGRRSYLRRHMVTHTRVQNTCKKASVRKTNTTRRTIPKHTGIKNFKCEICMRAYVHMKDLTKHMSTHTHLKDVNPTPLSTNISTDQSQHTSEFLINTAEMRKEEIRDVWVKEEPGANDLFDIKDVNLTHLDTGISTDQSQHTSQLPCQASLTLINTAEITRESSGMGVKEKPGINDLIDIKDVNLTHLDTEISTDQSEYTSELPRQALITVINTAGIQKEEISDMLVKDEPGVNDLFEEKFHIEEEQSSFLGYAHIAKRKSVECRLCGEPFAHISALSQHMGSHLNTNIPSDQSDDATQIPRQASLTLINTAEIEGEYIGDVWDDEEAGTNDLLDITDLITNLYTKISTDQSQHTSQLGLPCQVSPTVITTAEIGLQKEDIIDVWVKEEPGTDLLDINDVNFSTDLSADQSQHTSELPMNAAEMRKEISDVCVKVELVTNDLLDRNDGNFTSLSTDIHQTQHTSEFVINTAEMQKEGSSDVSVKEKRGTNDFFAENYQIEEEQSSFLRYVHISKRKSVECRFCGEPFAHISALSQHMGFHLNTNIPSDQLDDATQIPLQAYLTLINTAEIQEDISNMSVEEETGTNDLFDITDFITNLYTKIYTDQPQHTSQLPCQASPTLINTAEIERESSEMGIIERPGRNNLIDIRDVNFTNLDSNISPDQSENTSELPRPAMVTVINTADIHKEEISDMLVKEEPGINDLIDIKDVNLTHLDNNISTDQSENTSELPRQALITVINTAEIQKEEIRDVFVKEEPGINDLIDIKDVNLTHLDTNISPDQSDYTSHSPRQASLRPTLVSTAGIQKEEISNVLAKEEPEICDFFEEKYHIEEEQSTFLESVAYRH